MNCSAAPNGRNRSARCIGSFRPPPQGTPTGDLSGLTLRLVEDDSIDVVFSFDVFVRLAPVDTYVYLREMKRVLKNGGCGALTLASILSEGGFQKFVSEVDRHRDGRRGSEQFGYLAPPTPGSLPSSPGAPIKMWMSLAETAVPNSYAASVFEAFRYADWDQTVPVRSKT